MDHTQRSLAVAAAGLDEQRKAIDSPDTAENSVKAAHIVGADRTVGRIPIGDEGLANFVSISRRIFWVR